MNFAHVWIQRIAWRTRNWDIREWAPFGFGVQVVLILIYQLGLWLWPSAADDSAPIQVNPEMTFVEFTEVKDVRAAESQDLSDKIQEVDQLKQEVNWENAVDPAFDFSQRYVALLSVRKGPDDYPRAARNASLGRVTVAVRLYIDARGKIRDVRIRNIRSDGDAHKPFEREFMAAVRNLLLNKTEVRSRPYLVNGVAQDIVWDETITFTLDQ